MPNVIELWEERLMEKGRAEGKRSIAETMKSLGYSLEDIKKVTGLML